MFGRWIVFLFLFLLGLLEFVPEEYRTILRWTSFHHQLCYIKCKTLKIVGKTWTQQMDGTKCTSILGLWWQHRRIFTKRSMIFWVCSKNKSKRIQDFFIRSHRSGDTVFLMIVYCDRTFLLCLMTGIGTVFDHSIDCLIDWLKRATTWSTANKSINRPTRKVSNQLILLTKQTNISVMLVLLRLRVYMCNFMKMEM